jgi:hypothetical protein
MNFSEAHNFVEQTREKADLPMSYETTPTLLLAGLFGCMLGCATEAEPSDKLADVVAVEEALSSPTPVASLKLTSGSTVDFYDFGSAALVVETGAAYSSPALNIKGSIPLDQLVSTWTHLAPKTPAPPALEQLQRRLMSLPVDSNAPDMAPSLDDMPSLDTGGDKLGDIGSAKTNAPVGCNNGCCDFNWLSTLAECQGNYSYRWFLYNYGWSYASSNNDALYQGLVCSAQGTSTYSVQISGSGGVWSIPQATYRWFHWSSGTRRNMTSSVNASSNQHLHTYCGGVN